MRFTLERCAWLLGHCGHWARSQTCSSQREGVPKPVGEIILLVRKYFLWYSRLTISVSQCTDFSSRSSNNAIFLFSKHSSPAVLKHLSTAELTQVWKSREQAGYQWQHLRLQSIYYKFCCWADKDGCIWGYNVHCSCLLVPKGVPKHLELKF